MRLKAVSCFHVRAPIWCESESLSFVGIGSVSAERTSTGGDDEGTCVCSVRAFDEQSAFWGAACASGTHGHWTPVSERVLDLLRVSVGVSAIPLRLCGVGWHWR